MAKFDIKGPSAGDAVSATLRNPESGEVLLRLDHADWGNAGTSGGGDEALAVDVDFGAVHRIPASAFGAAIEAIAVTSQPGIGHVSVQGTDVLVNTVDEGEIRADFAASHLGAKPDPVWTLRDADTNPLAYMVMNNVNRAPGMAFSFSLSVKPVGQAPVAVTVTATPALHRQMCGWSCGRGIKLSVDETDATVLEPAERHADLYTSNAPGAYGADDIIAEVGSWLARSRIGWYIAAQLTIGGGVVSGQTVAHDPATYFGSQAKPIHPDIAREIVKSLYETSGFGTVYLHYERGYDYRDNVTNLNVGGDGLLHPHAILAYGSGARPLMPGMAYNGSKKHGLFFRGVAFPMNSGVGGAGITNVIFEDTYHEDKIYLYSDSSPGAERHPRFTVRNSVLPQAFELGGLQRDGEHWSGNYRPSCIKPGSDPQGVIIQGCFIGWGGQGPDYVSDPVADAYSYEPIGSDLRWGLDGYSQPGANLWTHPVYFDSSNRHILWRDNWTFGSGGSLIQLRGGAVMRSSAFTYGNQCFAVGTGAFVPYHAEDPACGYQYGYGNGHRSLCQDVVYTHAGYMSGAGAGMAQSEGIKIGAPLTSMDRVVVLHDCDPNNASDRDRVYSDWLGRNMFRLEGYSYTTDFDPGAEFENLEGRERAVICADWGPGINPDYNPDGLDLSGINEATIFRWYDAKRGNAPDTTTDIMEIYWWLREHEGPEIQALVRDFIAFMQAPLGIAPAWRTSAGPCSFVPDLAEDGCRWDNPNNWGGDLIPGSFAADTAALGGHKVFFQDHTLTVAGLDLGAGGHVHAVNGRLNVSAAPSCTGGGAITTDESGQIWIAGYAGPAPLALTVKGGRFANTGDFSGPADIRIDGSTDPHGVAEFLCAYGEASMTIRSGRSLEITGGGPRVGFDGLGGAQARLSFEAGAELRFLAGDGRLATIREFRSGVNGTQAPDIVSSVELGGAALVLDLTGVAAGSHALIAADSVTGRFGSVSGTIDPGLDATVAVSATGVSLTVTAGSGRIELA
ncbi:hypothetical protein [Rhodovulum sp. YEN HP10]|uniref:hypothetical protein n=1 Tax=Rhodovulum sp. HP10 TaxID=3387397 RepID=UPI0039E0EB55